MAKDFKLEDVQTGLTEVCKSFLSSVVAIVSYDKTKKDVNYVRQLVTFPDGGVYLVSVLHVDGPEFDMEQYRFVADSQELVATSPKSEESTSKPE